MEKVGLKNRIIPFIGAVAVFILCFSILYLGENVGLSDNGDFRRVQLVNNLEYANDTDYRYLFKEYYTMKIEGDTFGEMVKSVWSTTDEDTVYSSPHFLFVKISKVLNLINNIWHGRSLGNYDIGFLAVIYCLMMACAAWTFFTFMSDKAKKYQIAVFLAFILMFCDAGYVLYFNSLYGEPLQYLSLLLIIGIGAMISKRPSAVKVVLFYISLYLFAGSKLANIPLSVLIAVTGLIFLTLKKGVVFKTSVIASVIIFVVSAVNMYISIPEWMQEETTYQAVFFGIVKESDTIQDDLRELGVDEKYEKLANTHAYMEEYPVDKKSDAFNKDFYEKVSKTDIALFYLKHPSRLLEKTDIAIENSVYIRPPNLGNSSVRIMEFTDKFSLWSNFRGMIKFLYKPWAFYLLFALFTLAVIIYAADYIKNRKSCNKSRLTAVCALLLLVISTAVNLVLPIIGNGEADIAKHLFLYINFVDLCIFVCIIKLVSIKPIKSVSALSAAAVFTVLFYISPVRETVNFGRYNGKAIEWQILEKLSDGSCIMITKEDIAQKRFDGSNNMWEGSELREWLNTDFLEEFSEEEKDRILPVKNEILLSASDKGLAVSGDHPHYWNFTISQADDLSDTAYKYYIEDYVYIPTLKLAKKTTINDSYWILCPYTNNDKMERYMKRGGYILHTNVNNTRNVRAVIRYKEEK